MVILQSLGSLLIGPLLMYFRSCPALKTKSLFSLVLNEFLINNLLIHFFRLKEVLLVTLLTLGALVTLVILVTTKDQMIQAGSCCPTWVPLGSMIHPESCDPSL